MIQNDTTAILLPVPSAAKALGIGNTLTWQIIRDGQLKAVKVGRRTLIRRSDLDAFVDRLSDGRTLERGVR